MRIASTCRPRDVLAGAQLQIGDKFLDTATDFVADGAYGIKTLSSGVVEFPVEVSLAREDGASIAAAHADNHIAGLDCPGRENLRFLVCEIDTVLAHGFNDSRVDGVGWGRAGGEDFDSISGEVRKVPGSHLGAASVVDTDKQHGGLGGHGILFCDRSCGDRWRQLVELECGMQMVDIAGSLQSPFGHHPDSGPLIQSTAE